MNMKHVLGLLILAVLFTACGGAPSPKEMMGKVADVTEELVGAMEKAENAPAVAAALNTYTDRMEKLIPEMKALYEKHPELKEMKNNDKMPAEYKDVEERLNKAGERMFGAMMKMGQYAQDEAVLKAQQRMAEVMAKMK
jgi:hypothetical protein